VLRRFSGRENDMELETFPVGEPYTACELSKYLTTIHALGLTIPPCLLFSADEVMFIVVGLAGAFCLPV